MAEIAVPVRQLPATLGSPEARAKRRAALGVKIPRWVDDADRRNEVLGVYARYLDHTPVARICEEFKILPAQVQRHVQACRAELKFLFLDNVETVTHEQILLHQRIINEAMTSLRSLRESQTYTDRTTGELVTKRLSGLEAAAMARAEADLLRVIGEQQKAIEELMGISDRAKPGPKPGAGPSMDTPEGGTTIIIDLRSVAVQGG